MSGGENFQMQNAGDRKFHPICAPLGGGRVGSSLEIATRFLAWHATIPHGGLVRLTCFVLRGRRLRCIGMKKGPLFCLCWWLAQRRECTIALVAMALFVAKPHDGGGTPNLCKRTRLTLPKLCQFALLKEEKNKELLKKEKQPFTHGRAREVHSGRTGFA